MRECPNFWKVIIEFIAAVALSSPGYSQQNNNDINYTTDLDSIEYHLLAESLAPSSIQFPFGGIVMTDARFDTSKLGFEIHKKYVNLGIKDFKKIKLKGGVKSNISDFYNDYYQHCFSHSDDRLFIVIKTLWIDNLPDHSYREERIINIIKESYEDIYIKVEFYLKRVNDYYPLKRVDTVFQLTEQNIHSPDLKFKKNNLSFFLFTLKSLLETYDFNTMTAYASIKKQLSINEIDSFNNKRFSIPVLKAKMFTNGVYLHFKEFANNDPSVGENDYNIDKKGRVMIKEDRADERFYWAYANDSGIHIQGHRKVDFKRIGNTFEFFLGNLTSIQMTLTGNILDMNKDKGKKLMYLLTPRQIDMETGIIY